VTDIALLEQARARLLSDLERVTEEAAAFEPVPGARTITESLLHVAAVEFVFAASLLVRQGREEDLECARWEHVKAGLATEIGYDPPKDVGVRECLDALVAARALTRAALSREPPTSFVGPDDLCRGLEALRAGGADLGEDRLEALLPKLGSHLGAGSLGVVLIAHEEYHRGQILYQNFLAARMVGV